MKLATLCSQAVDYAKNGNPVVMRNNLPKLLIKFRPDWHKAEVTGTRERTTMFRSARWGICSGTSSSSIRKSLSKGYPQNPPKQNPHSKIRSRMFSRRSFTAYSTRTRTRTRMVPNQTRRVRTATRNSCTSTMFVVHDIRKNLIR
jgi:hypothetical protein